MSNSPSNQPIRSISLPSRPHPLVPQIDEHLSRLRVNSDSEVSSTSESQLTSLGHKLNNLKQLYDCLDDFLLLSQNQQKIVQFSNVKRVDDLIDGSLKLLDVCGNVKDVLSQIKEHIHEIQSSLRRRANGEVTICDKLVSYVNMRKKSKFLSKKCLKDVKGMIKELNSHHGDEEKNDANFAVIDVLIKVEGVTAEIFEFLLEILLGCKPHSHKRNGGLSIKMCKFIMHQNSDIAKEEVVNGNEFEDVDSILSSFSIVHKKKNCIDSTQAEKLRDKLVKLDSRVQDLDEILEGLFRCLVRSRVTLLNVLS